jgi:hypothetical protein
MMRNVGFSLTNFTRRPLDRSMYLVESAPHPLLQVFLAERLQREKTRQLAVWA